ncbi:MAG: fused MFS/spermidine synthase [Deltaproteobacteria bacterium]|nr:fused MFS/spermidine synthase [Deltaproteobacteria bacterium]
MPGRSCRIAALLALSGMCALIYQMAWLRELRLVFGASTHASAAVLAVFMGGLGAGSLWLGKRADRVGRPLRLYANLEGGIAVFAALTPALLIAVRAGYVALGGSTTLGTGLGTVVRLALSALVLLPPTLLMGGTLPAAARAAIPRGDEARRTTALLYGLNTLGAVTGAALATFVLLETYGTRMTLWLGCAINLAVALAAHGLDRWEAQRDPARTARPAQRTGKAEGPRSSAAETREDRSGHSITEPGQPNRTFVLIAAAGVGFVFLQMELVWYRVLSPLLGGSSYTFGLILAVALAGIGLGGLAYTLRGATRRPRLGLFALSCGLEALCLAVPYALGDRLALLAIFLRTWGTIGLHGHLAAWTLITSLVVLPAAIVAGYQFPLLIALLGRARRSVGHHVGLAYGSNTAGAIAGSLAVGFLALPSLGALGAWKLAVWLLVILGVAALILQLRSRARLVEIVGPASAIVLAVVLIHVAIGPTAVWRHSPIGAGRVDDWAHGATRNSLKRQMHERRRAITWEVDGRESTIALYTLNDTSFLVNGKSDGAAVLDAGTQVMGGLLGALLHPGQVDRALVIGLGTGSTAGWLGALPAIEQVDVVELEPAMAHVARECAPVNRAVLDNPKVHLIFADAREVLLTTPHRYDLIFSEPSNPYRAGIASLFTREFYQAVRERLEPAGMFVQWVQAYEIDAESVRTVYATLAAVFPSVESWRTKYSDLVLIGRDSDVPIDLDRLAERVAQQPYADALMSAWRVDTVEGVLAHHVARPSLTRAIADRQGPAGINTDDRNLLEFAIARALGRSPSFSIDELQRTAADRGEARPIFVGDGEQRVDWRRLTDDTISMHLAEGSRPRLPPHLTVTSGQRHRLRAQKAWRRDQYKTVVREWKAQKRPPHNAVELLVLADAYAVTGDTVAAEPLIEKLAWRQPIEADVVRARLHWASHESAEAWPFLLRAFAAYRTNPWPNSHLMAAGMQLVFEIARQDETRHAAAEGLLKSELAVHNLDYLRVDLLLDLGIRTADARLCSEALVAFGPHLPWDKSFLERRVWCYTFGPHPELTAAEADLAAFLADSGQSFGEGLAPPASAGATASASSPPQPSATAAASADP